jgi:hypothetical protein
MAEKVYFLQLGLGLGLPFLLHRYGGFTVRDHCGAVVVLLGEAGRTGYQYLPRRIFYLSISANFVGYLGYYSDYF